MSRVLLLGIALALAALCVPSDATGAPASSPFAGQYRGGLPDSGSGGWYITISDKGAVTAWWSLSEAYYHGDGEASGQVADGGAIRVRGKEWAQ